MAAHELKYAPGEVDTTKRPKQTPRPFWYCTCSRFCGGDGVGWVCYITQPRTGMKAGKPDRMAAIDLHRRHITESQEPEDWQ